MYQNSTNVEKFDVTLSTLNSAHKLRECLDSIVREIPVGKIIVVDGGSTDETINVLKEYQDVDLHIRPDLNLGQSREYAFSKVTTEWFAQIDSDVVLREGWLDEMLKNRDRGDVVEGGRVEHYSIPLPNDGKYSRAMYDQCLIRKKAVEGVKINCLHLEEELTRRCMESRGYSWFKHGTLLADHYSQPVRYDNIGKNKLIIQRASYPKWAFAETGRVDAISGMTFPATLMKIAGKIAMSLVHSLKEIGRSVVGNFHYLKGYIGGRREGKVVSRNYKIGIYNYIKRIKNS